MNDKKIRYLTEGITKDIVSYLMEDEGLSMTEAIALSSGSLIPRPGFMSKVQLTCTRC